MFKDGSLCKLRLSQKYTKFKNSCSRRLISFLKPKEYYNYQKICSQIGIIFMEHEFLNYVYFWDSLCKLLGLNFRRVSTRKWKVVRVKMTNVDAKLNKFTPKKRTKDIEKDSYPHIKIGFFIMILFRNKFLYRFIWIKMFLESYRCNFV